MWHYPSPTTSLVNTTNLIKRSLSILCLETNKKSHGQVFPSNKVAENSQQTMNSKLWTKPQDMPKWLSKALRSRNRWVGLFFVLGACTFVIIGVRQTQSHTPDAWLSVCQGQHDADFTAEHLPIEEPSTGQQKEGLVFWRWTVKNCNGNSSMETLC